MRACQKASIVGLSPVPVPLFPPIRNQNNITFAMILFISILMVMSPLDAMAQRGRMPGQGGIGSKWEAVSLDGTPVNIEGELTVEKLNGIKNLELRVKRGRGGISAVHLKWLLPLKTLKALDVPGCMDLHNDHIKQLAQLTGLTQLTLSYCEHITDKGLEHLEKMTGLEKLTLHRCRELSRWGLMSVCKLKKLKSLTLREISINSEDLALLANLPDLKELNIIECRSIGADCTKYIGALDGLQSLSLPGMHKITDEGMDQLEALVNLKHLDLSRCSKISGKGLDKFKMLETIDLSGYRRQLTKEFPEILGKLNKLKELYLPKDHMPESMVSSIQKDMPDLTIHLK